MSVVFFMTGLMKSESDEANLRIFFRGVLRSLRGCRD